MVKNNPGKISGRRVAIVGGLRTPFLKSGTDFRDLSALDLASGLVAELLARTGLGGDQIDQLVFGAVVGDVMAPNVAREIVLATGLPRSIDAYSVSRACATSTQAIVNGTTAILTGDADIVIAGGTDSLSKPPLLYDDAVVSALMSANASKDMASKLKSFSRLRPSHLAPRAPALADKSTGLTMGDAAEKMARENGITREAQDEYALESHRKAAEAWEKGVFEDEVMPFAVGPTFATTVHKDNITRPDGSLEKLAKLKPVFDRRYGTVTAGNSSPLTDGAAAVVLMEEATAAALGVEPLAFIRSWAFAALDPGWQMLMGPAFASPVALDRAGMSLSDIDVVDMHEAFAAQMLSNLQAFGSKAWAQEHLGRPQATGEIDPERLNLYGGSVSLGHPFAATGARQALTMAHELDRRDAGTALITQCAAGGLGAALIIER